MIQVLDVNVMIPAADFVEKPWGDGISPLRDDLKRRTNTNRLVDIHQGRAKVPSGLGFDIVGDDGSTVRTVRPEPDKWYRTCPCGLQQKEQNSIKEVINRY